MAMAPVSVRCMVMIGLVLLVGCERVSRAVDTWRGRRPLEAWRRDRFEVFESEAELARYLDAAVFVGGHRSGATAPTPPADVPSRGQPPGSSVNMTGWRAQVGGFSYASRRDRAERMVARDGFVFVLYDDRLHSYAIDPTSKALEPRATLKLGDGVPSGRIEHRLGDGIGEGGAVNTAESLLDVRVFAHLFAAERQLIVLGSVQHRHAIELVRVSVGERGELERSETTWLHVRPIGSDGYRARMLGQTLVMYVPHDVAYGGVYALPGIGAGENIAAPRALLRGQQVYHPVVNTLSPDLHVMIRCDLTVRPLACAAQALLGPDSAAVMASDAAYLWFTETEMEESQAAPAVIARLPYDGSPPTGVIVQGVQARTTDEALHETQSSLHALVERTGKESAIELVNVPRSQFSAQPTQVPEASYHPVARSVASDSVTFNAYVGDYLIVHDRPSQDWQASSTSIETRFVHLVDAVPTALKLGHSAAAALELGDHALIVGTDALTLQFSVVNAKVSPPRIVTKQVVAAVRSIDAYGNPRVMAANTDATWMQVEIKADQKGRSTRLLPLRFRPTGPSLEAAPEWSFEAAAGPYSIDVVSLATDIIALRAENQLLVQHLTQPPTTLQRIALDP
jgi:hypothetical protein